MEVRADQRLAAQRRPGIAGPYDQQPPRQGVVPGGSASLPKDAHHDTQAPEQEDIGGPIDQEHASRKEIDPEEEDDQGHEDQAAHGGGFDDLDEVRGADVSPQASVQLEVGQGPNPHHDQQWQRLRHGVGKLLVRVEIEANEKAERVGLGNDGRLEEDDERRPIADDEQLRSPEPAGYLGGFKIYRAAPRDR